MSVNQVLSKSLLLNLRVELRCAHGFSIQPWRSSCYSLQARERGNARSSYQKLLFKHLIVINRRKPHFRSRFLLPIVPKSK